MSQRTFELSTGIFESDNRDLHASFRHHLDHILKVSYIPDTRPMRIVLEDFENRSFEELFGGKDGEFNGLYHIMEIK